MPKRSLPKSENKTFRAKEEIMKNIEVRIISTFLLSILLVGGFPTSAFGRPPAAQSPTDFSVNFTNCVESIGVGPVPTANARQYIPAEFIPVGEGQPVTPLVVRTARCAIAVDGHAPRVGRIVQIGAVIVPPDGTGDINNYSFFYYTDDLRLALRLNLAGVRAQFVPTLVYDYDGGTSFFVRVPLPGIPRFKVSGAVTPSPSPAGSFVANWWQKTDHGSIRMQTGVPVINIGGANLTLTTNQNGPLGQLVGGAGFGFPIIQQFNSFAAAAMGVSAP
jgi:hypothetical protein